MQSIKWYFFQGFCGRRKITCAIVQYLNVKELFFWNFSNFEKILGSVSSVNPKTSSEYKQKRRIWLSANDNWTGILHSAIPTNELWLWFEIENILEWMLAICTPPVSRRSIRTAVAIAEWWSSQTLDISLGIHTNWWHKQRRQYDRDYRPTNCRWSTSQTKSWRKRQMRQFP